MPDKKVILNQYQGINRDGSQYNMSMTWLWDLLNGYLDRTEDGRDVIVQRDGLTKVNSSDMSSTVSESIKVLYEAVWSDLDSDIFFTTADGVWYLNGSNAPVKAYNSADTTSEVGDFTMFNDLLIAVAADKTIRQINQSFTVAALSSDSAEPTNIVACHTHNHRLILADTGFKVYMSRVDDATSATAWSANNDFVQIDLKKVINQTDRVVNFATLGESLLVIFCINFTVIYDVPTTFEGIRLQQVIPVGLNASHAFGVLGSDIIFTTRTGIKLLTAATATSKLDVQDLTKNTGNLYRRLVNNSSSINFVHNMGGSVFNRLNQYLISFNGTEERDNLTLVYSFKHQNFVGIYRFHEMPTAWLEDKNGDLFFGTSEGRIFKFDSSKYLDNLDAINFRVEFPYFGSEFPFSNKSIKSLRALIETNQDTTIFTKYRNGFAGEEVNNSQTVSTTTIGDPDNLVVTVASTSTVTVTADSIFIDGKRHENVSVTIDIDNSGANGLDTGAKAANKDYGVFLIYDSVNDTVAGLFSLLVRSNVTVFDHPDVLPSNYTKFRYVGSAETDGSSLIIDRTTIGSNLNNYDQGIDAPTLMEDDSAIGRGNEIGIKIEHNTPSSRVKIHSVQLHYTEESEK